MSRYRRSTTLAFYFGGRGLRCKNFLTGVELATDAVVVALLERLDRWRTAEETARALPSFTAASVRRTLDELVAATLVVEKGSEQDRRERRLDAWKDWGLEARFLHFATKNVRYELPEDEAQTSRTLLARAPMPPFVKEYPGAPRLALPRRLARLRGDALVETFLGRRTHRRFDETKAVSFDAFALLLELAASFTGTIAWPGLGRVPVRTSPSGGARHPLELYVLARRIAGVEPGLYHYRPDEHALERLRTGASREETVRDCGGQEWVGGAAALFFLTAVVGRVTWRYRFSRAYRVLLLEAGHLGQSLCLAATRLGLAPFSTAALDDTAIENALGIDGAAETILYVVGVGLPRALSRFRPLPSLGG